MDETLIPWGFLGMMLGICIAILIVAVAGHAFNVRKRRRLTSPRKDYLYRPKPTGKARE